MDTASKSIPLEGEERAIASDPPAEDTKSPRREGRAQQRRRKVIAAPVPEAWSPPDFGGQRRTRIGASLVEEFVAGHDAGDVLRELVQNEFDAGGDRLAVTFGEDSFDVIGNGRGIRADGWKRLSVIVGTGRVVGEETADRITPKTNGIGSKNFGLRSLFLFGDEIYVRSRGHVANLHLPTLGTAKIPDPTWSGGTGVRLNVPYRRSKFEKLEPFTAEQETYIFEMMTGGMLATLVKLALVGRKPGLRELVLRSVRSGRTISWRQKAETVQCHMRGVSALRRTGRLTDQRDDETANTRKFEELEFTRAVTPPAEYAGVSYPDYYRRAGGMIRIGVSLPVARRRIDLTKTGNFYYPLQTPDSLTGSAVSVSAPFDLDSDRSSLLDNSWNRWLIDRAATLTIDLLKDDWFRRFGADAFRALIPNGPPRPTQFADAIATHLSEEACWPTRAASPSNRYASASRLVLLESPLLDGFLSDSRYLDPSLEADEDVRALAIKSGATRFTISSLVRLRCAGENRSGLETKIEKSEADYHYTSYETALSDSNRQATMAGALTALSRRLSKANRVDLRSSPSTLTATNELKPAEKLVRVDPGIWEVCPEPMANRLHRDLIPHRAIASLCQEFDEQDWMVRAADRAREGWIDDSEREALYAKLLADGTRMSRRALTTLRDSPIARNQRGEWTAPSKMVVLKGAQARLMSPVVSAPSKELMARPALLAQLRIRSRLNGDDILAYATLIGARPQMAGRFEALLNDNQRLLTPALVEELESVAFLRARSGELVCPSDLHFDTPTNRLCLEDEGRIVGESNEVLYRRLRIREHPTIETLLDVLTSSRERSEAPSCPDALYPTLVSALGRGRGKRANLADEPILWVGSDYHAPNEVLVGSYIPRLFDGVVPVLRGADLLSQAYLALGARAQPRDEHWIWFFEHVSETLNNGEAVSSRDRHNLREAYRQRGSAGLPEDLDEDACCLLDHAGRLFSLSDLRTGLLVEGDYPALAQALAAVGSAIGIADLTEKSRAFFLGLGIRPLTSIAGAGTPIFGASTPPPLWFKPQHRASLLAMLRRPLFSRALYELALRQTHMFRPVDLAELRRRVESITGIDFLDSISCEYCVNGQIARVSVETAVQHGVIGLVRPRTKLDFQQLLAQSLANLAGATNVAHARALSTAFFPLVLCHTADDIRVYLERMGVDMQGWSDDQDDQIDLDDNDADDVREEILRQMMQDMNTTRREPEKVIGGLPSGKKSAITTPAIQKSIASPPSSQPPFTLPDLSEVTMSVAPASGQQMRPKRTQGWGSGDSSNGWAPRSSAEVERDRDVGRRGEELVYQIELERVRAMGCEYPEDVVIWTSQFDPGADHDIRSVEEDGRVRWIEVKSTTGTDGRFEWSRKEFEKALREGDGYELWRVYKAATTSPIAKRFANPVALLGASRLGLELGSLRASVEGLD